MKNKRQYRDSAMFTLMGYLGIILVVVAILLGVGEYTGFNKKVKEGLQNDPRPLSPIMNYLPPSFYDTINDDMMDIDMDCGDSYYDSIPEYSSFNDVPASIDTVIRVDGILYKTNNNKTSWVPIYPDEYVMWVGNNGDTIWE
tara:strand:- start:719 stop:1144 length:426 start_codon:yes stop_codon:yes gene_type:complete